MVRLEKKGQFQQGEREVIRGHPETSGNPGETHTHCQEEGSFLRLSLPPGWSPRPLVDASRSPESQSSERSGWGE